MKPLNITYLFVLLAALLVLSTCKDNSVSQEPPPEEGVETKNSVTAEPEDQPADSGEVGLVINTREIFRKGYTAKEAEVTLPGYSAFSETLEINPVTSIAVLSISNEELTEEEKNAFASGIQAEITVYDSQDTELAEYVDQSLVLDDSGRPVNITNNDLEYKIPPINLGEGIPYYIQPKEIGGEGDFGEGAVLRAETDVFYYFGNPNSVEEEDIWELKYYFAQNDDGTYYIQRGVPDMEGEVYYLTDDTDGRKTCYDDPVLEVTKENEDAVKFVLEQDKDGWVRILKEGTDKYLTIVEGTCGDDPLKALSLKKRPGNRFRFISTNITWNTKDQGTEFHEPIMPPAQNDFSFQSTYINCSQGLVTQTVGNTETRTSERAASSTETVELYGSITSTIGVELGAKVGGDLYGAEASVSVSAELEVSTSATETNAQTLSETQIKSVAVSSSRTIEIPPGTGVEVYDLVRTVEGAVIPYTQVVRLEADYENGPSLTGDEIRTQMLFNFVGGVPIDTGPDYVLVGLQGEIEVDKMYSYEGKADDIPNACD